MNERELEIRIAKLEALFAGTPYEGEKQAAKQNLDRLLDRLHQEQARDQVAEMKYTGLTTQSKKLFIALLSRYGLRPYRYYRQKYTTVMVKGPQDFLNNVVWAEFLQLNDLLEEHLDEVTDRIISQNICSSVEEEKEIKQLGG